MKTEFQLLTLIFVLSGLNCQLSKCMDTSNFLNKHSKDIEKGFALQTFLKRSLPGETMLPEHFLGQGSFGVVYKYGLKAKDRKTFIETAMKVVSYNNEELKHLNNELTFLQRYSKKYPLELLRYYACIDSQPNQKVLIFTEKFDRDFKNKAFRLNEFRKIGLEKMFEIFLMMGRAIKRITDLKYVHLDIKMENFMLKTTGEDWIVKPIDFGLAKPIGTTFFGGTDSTMDPAIYKQGNNYKADPKADVYSLGWTLTFIFYPMYDFYRISEACTYDYQNFLACSKIRYTQFKKLVDDMPTKLKNYHGKQTYIEFSNLLLRMIEIDVTKRCDINYVVEELNRILSRMRPESKYLNENIAELKELFYADLDDSTTPLLSEDFFDVPQKPMTLNRSTLGSSFNNNKRPAFGQRPKKQINKTLASSISSQVSDTKQKIGFGTKVVPTLARNNTQKNLAAAPKQFMKQKSVPNVQTMQQKPQLAKTKPNKIENKNKLAEPSNKSNNPEPMLLKLETPAIIDIPEVIIPIKKMEMIQLEPIEDEPVMYEFKMEIKKVEIKKPTPTLVDESDSSGTSINRISDDRDFAKRAVESEQYKKIMARINANRERREELERQRAKKVDPDAIKKQNEQLEAIFQQVVANLATKNTGTGFEHSFDSIPDRVMKNGNKNNSIAIRPNFNMRRDNPDQKTKANSHGLYKRHFQMAFKLI